MSVRMTFVNDSGDSALSPMIVDMPEFLRKTIQGLGTDASDTKGIPRSSKKPSAHSYPAIR